MLATAGKIGDSVRHFHGERWRFAPWRRTTSYDLHTSAVHRIAAERVGRCPLWVKSTLAATAAALPAVTSAARAETYPSRPVHWIVSFLAGGANDIVARIIGQYLSDY